MAYKLIKEWKGVLGDHEITMYKYNISHDEMVRYYLDPTSEETRVIIRTYLAQDEVREEFYGEAI